MYPPILNSSSKRSYQRHLLQENKQIINYRDYHNYNKLFTRDCIQIKLTNRDYQRLLETIEEYFWSEP